MSFIPADVQQMQSESRGIPKTPRVLTRAMLRKRQSIKNDPQPGEPIATVQEERSNRTMPYSKRIPQANTTRRPGRIIGGKTAANISGMGVRVGPAVLAPRNQLNSSINQKKCLDFKRNVSSSQDSENYVSNNPSPLKRRRSRSSYGNDGHNKRPKVPTTVPIRSPMPRSPSPILERKRAVPSSPYKADPPFEKNNKRLFNLDMLPPLPPLTPSIFALAKQYSSLNQQSQSPTKNFIRESALSSLEHVNEADESIISETSFTSAGNTSMSSETSKRLDSFNEMLRNLSKPRKSYKSSSINQELEGLGLRRIRSRYNLREENGNRPVRLTAENDIFDDRAVEAEDFNTSLDSLHLGNGDDSMALRRSISVANVSMSSTTISSILANDSVSTALSGIVAFIDVKTADGDDAGTVFADMLKQLGAKVTTRSTSLSVTHIVFKGGKSQTLQRFQSLKNPKPFLVGVGWVVKCAELGVRVAEQEYCIAELDAVAGPPQKFQRRGGMGQAPKVLGSLNQQSASFVHQRDQMQANIAASIAKVKRKAHPYAPKVSSPLGSKIYTLSVAEIDEDIDEN